MLVPSQCSRRLCLLWLAQRHIWRFQTFSNRCNRILWWLSADFFVVACFSREWKTYLATIYLDFPALAGNFKSQNTFIGIRAGAWRSSQESCKWVCSWTRLKTSKSNVKLCQIKYTASSAWSQLGTLISHLHSGNQTWRNIPDDFPIETFGDFPWPWPPESCWLRHQLATEMLLLACSSAVSLPSTARLIHWDLLRICSGNGLQTRGDLYKHSLHHMIWGVNLWAQCKYHYQWDFWQCVGCAGRWPLLIRQVPFGPCVCKWFK